MAPANRVTERNPQAWLQLMADSNTPLLPWQDGREAQCNRLIVVINDQQQAIANADTRSPKGMRLLAEELDLSAIRVTSVALANARLLTFRNDYNELFSDFARLSRATAAAMTAKSRAALAEVRTGLKKIPPRERMLVTAINGYCQEPNKTRMQRFQDSADQAAAVCRAGDAEACVAAIGDYQSRKDWAKLAALEATACDTNANVCVSLGSLYRRGAADLKSDPLKSLGFSARGCVAGNAKGCFEAAHYYVDHPTKVNGVDGGGLLLARSCATEFIEACDKLREVYPEGPPQAPSIREPLAAACREGKRGACKVIVR